MPAHIELLALLDAAHELSTRAGETHHAARLNHAAGRLRAPAARVLVSGLCSVGKSSFVSALWGDSELLPTAVRDCTQTNTLIRIPGANEGDRQLWLSYLAREQALDFATRDLSFYRLHEFLNDADALTAGKLSDLLPEERLRQTVQAVRALFARRNDLLVLNEHLTDELNKLDEFLSFIDSPDFKPGATVQAAWDQRQPLLMGRRDESGRTHGVGKLLAFKHVAMARDSRSWTIAPPPEVIDTPWIPTFHNARRADLILDQARQIDLLLVLALPDQFDPEPWVRTILQERPELRGRTFVVYNQIDTVNLATLFARDGFAHAFEKNAERLDALKIPRENLYMSCARLPFLQGLPQDDLVAARVAKLQTVLTKIHKAAADRAPSAFTRPLLAATDINDAGLVTLRKKIETFSQTRVLPDREKEARAAFDAAHDSAVLGANPADTAAWQKLRERRLALPTN